MPAQPGLQERARPGRKGDTRVSDIMSRRVYTCGVGDTLDRPARLMWDHDCGAIPIVDPRGHVVGMVTDRDICMAAYTQGKPLGQIPVTTAASRHIHSVPPDESVAVAQEIIKMHRVRRLPVVDIGGNLVGILSIADIVRNAGRSRAPDDPLHVEHVASTLAIAFRPSKRVG